MLNSYLLKCIDLCVISKLQKEPKLTLPKQFFLSLQTSVNLKDIINWIQGVPFLQVIYGLNIFQQSKYQTIDNINNNYERNLL